MSDVNQIAASVPPGDQPKPPPGESTAERLRREILHGNVLLTLLSLVLALAVSAVLIAL